MAPTQKAGENTGTDDGPTVELFGETEHYLPESEICGTEHILVDGELLCGHSQLRDCVENTDDRRGYTRVETDYPLKGYSTCKNCARIYVREHGSRDGLFDTAAHLEEGDWVRVSLADGRELKGRVRRDVGENVPTRFVKVVTSRLPVARWLYADLDILKLHVSEGDAKTEDGVAIEELERIPEPENSPDARLEATRDRIKDIVGDRAGTVMAVGTTRGRFHLNVDSSARLGEVVDDLEAGGFEVREVMPGTERTGTDAAAVSVQADTLDNAVETRCDGGTEGVERSEAEQRVHDYERNHRYPDVVPGPKRIGHARAWGDGEVVHCPVSDLPASETSGRR